MGLLLLGGYGLLLVGLYLFQRRLMYDPGREIGPPELYGLTGFLEQFLVTPDHETLQAWHRPARDGMATILYLHGNSYTLADRAPIFSALSDQGFGVFAVSYRGFGKSTGRPSEEGLYIDARTAIEFIEKEQHIKPSDLVLFGESLGTGVAIQMALEYPVAAVILQSPYTSVAQRAAEIYFYVPVRWMIKDRFDSLRKIGRVHAPLLVFHGESDETIPIRQGKALFEAANPPKKAHFFPGVGHCDFDSAVLAQQVQAFLQNPPSASP